MHGIFGGERLVAIAVLFTVDATNVALHVFSGKLK